VFQDPLRSRISVFRSQNSFSIITQVHPAFNANNKNNNNKNNSRSQKSEHESSSKASNEIPRKRLRSTRLWAAGWIRMQVQSFTAHKIDGKQVETCPIHPHPEPDLPPLDTRMHARDGRPPMGPQYRPHHRKPTQPRAKRETKTTTAGPKNRNTKEC